MWWCIVYTLVNIFLFRNSVTILRWIPRTKRKPLVHQLWNEDLSYYIMQFISVFIYENRTSIFGKFQKYVYCLIINWFICKFSANINYKMYFKIGKLLLANLEAMLCAFPVVYTQQLIENLDFLYQYQLRNFIHFP